MKTPREPALEPLPSSSSYFTSLEVAHLRCFGEAQTLSLRGDDGRPARWTIVLGENGLGKTTLLQLLALASGADYRRIEMELSRYEDGPFRDRLDLSRRGKVGTATAEMSGDGHGTVTIVVDSVSGLPPGAPDEATTMVCGYGAGRRIGHGRGYRRYRPSKGIRCANLFVDVGLRNAEEWLLQEDYASAKEGGEGAATRRLERLQDMLVRLLPDVSDVRVGATKRQWEPDVREPRERGSRGAHRLPRGVPLRCRRERARRADVEGARSRP